MIEYKETGGALIGMGRSTWPLAKLRVNKNVLELNATILGNLYFKPSDIISIEPYSEAFKNGIRINHTVANYSKKTVFLTSNPIAVINQISQTGFLNNTEPVPGYIEDEINKKQSQGGFPVKISAIVAVVIIWNVLMISDFTNILKGALGRQLAIAFLVILCALILTVKPVRLLILKEGREVDSIKPALYFLIILGILLFIGASAFEDLKLMH